MIAIITPVPMPNLPLFQEWCRSHNIWLDPRLELQLDDLTGLKVVAREAIPPETTSWSPTDSIAIHLD